MVLEGGNRELHALATLCDSSPQKEGSQMLLYRSRADAQLPGYFFITTALHQQIQNLLVSWCHLNLANLHFLLPACPVISL
jgi:hypothetical protein